jgi:hypothetical protein
MAKRTGRGSGKADAEDDLAGLKVPELRERAKRLDLSGISGMKKDELIAAIRKAGGGTGTAEAGDDTLRTIDEKLAEVLGLARAASTATERVAGLVDDDERRRLLERMGREAEETASRCTDALAGFGARRPKIEEKAGETTEEAIQMMETYLGGEDVEALDGFEFLVMAEAGETGHWQVLQAMNDKAGEAVIRELTEFAIPVQDRHLKDVLEATVALAAEEDPLEPA